MWNVHTDAVDRKTSRMLLLPARRDEHVCEPAWCTSKTTLSPVPWRREKAWIQESYRSLPAPVIKKLSAILPRDQVTSDDAPPSSICKATQMIISYAL